MKKIPTAKEIWNTIVNTNCYSESGKQMNIDGIKEFAKLHVTAALKAASRKAKAENNGNIAKWVNGSSINKESVLNAYPLNKIV